MTPEPRRALRKATGLPLTTAVVVLEPKSALPPVAVSHSPATVPVVPPPAPVPVPVPVPPPPVPPPPRPPAWRASRRRCRSRARAVLIGTGIRCRPDATAVAVAVGRRVVGLVARVDAEGAALEAEVVGGRVDELQTARCSSCRWTRRWWRSRRSGVGDRRAGAGNHAEVPDHLRGAAERGLVERRRHLEGVVAEDEVHRVDGADQHRVGGWLAIPLHRVLEDVVLQRQVARERSANRWLIMRPK